MNHHSRSARSFSARGTLGLLSFLLAACSSAGGGGGDGDGDGGVGDGDLGSGGAVGATGGNGSGGGGEVGSGGGAIASGGGMGTGGGIIGGTGGDSGVPKTTYLYVGSGDWSSEPGKVTVYEVNRTTKTLTFVSDHEAGGLASYLAIDSQNHRLFAVDEKNGGVLAFTINPDTGGLTPNGSEENDRHPVYLSLTPDNQYLLAANYSEGSVDVFPINESGQVGDSVQTVSTGQYAHCIVMDGTSRVLVANKGGDTISRFNYSAGNLTAQTPATTSLGSPRHITMGPDGRAYVVSEDDDLITAYDVEADGQLSLHFQTSRLPDGGPGGTGADIRVTPNGKYLYATNRDGENSIVAYDISGPAEVYIEHEPSQGQTPRNMTMDPRGEFIVVGNHGDGKIAVFTIGVDGALTHVLTEEVELSPYFVGLVDL